MSIMRENGKYKLLDVIAEPSNRFLSFTLWIVDYDRVLVDNAIISVKRGDRWVDYVVS